MVLKEGKIYWTGKEQFTAVQCEKCGSWGSVNRFWMTIKNGCLGKLTDGSVLHFQRKDTKQNYSLIFIEPEKHPELDLRLEVWADDETGGSACDNCL